MKEEMDEMIEDANSKLIREVEIEGDHPAKILAKCGDGTHLYYSFNHLPYELRRVIQNLPGTLGYTKVELESHIEDLIDMVKRLPDESPNQLQPLYRKFKEEELDTKKMVRDWRNSVNELNVFEDVKPLREDLTREECEVLVRNEWEKSKEPVREISMETIETCVNWMNSKDNFDLFEGTQPVGDLPYREEDRDGTRVLILEDSGYVVEK